MPSLTDAFDATIKVCQRALKHPLKLLTASLGVVAGIAAIIYRNQAVATSTISYSSHTNTKLPVPHIAVRFGDAEPVGFYPERGTNVWSTLLSSSENAGLANPDPLATKYSTGETVLLTQEVPTSQLPEFEKAFADLAKESSYSVFSTGYWNPTNHNCASAAAELSRIVQEKLPEQSTLECSAGNQLTTHCRAVAPKNL